MKKYIKIVIVLIIIATIILPYRISYGADEQEENVLEVPEELDVSSNLEVAINTDKIKFEKFILKLELNTKISDVEIEEETEISKENNDKLISIEVDKSSLSLAKLILQISLSDEIVVGDNIELIATIVDTESEKEFTEEYSILVIENSKEDDYVIEDEEIAQEPSKEENEELNQEEFDENSEIKENMEVNEEMLSEDREENSFNQDENMLNNDLYTEAEYSNFMSSSNTIASNINVASLNSVSNDISDLTQAVYNGSDNNYLKELTINSYELNKTFSKEASTYFITVGEEVNSLEISAIAEEENATVCIYGNDSLVTGENKVLITVTAENGNTRTYRIYVTKE